jgi:hypothetical protein
MGYASFRAESVETDMAKIAGGMVLGTFILAVVAFLSIYALSL